MSSSLSIEQRRAILEREIKHYVGSGFRVVSQTDTTAQLVKPKSPNRLLILLFLILSLLIFGLVLLFLYLIFYWLIAKDQQVYISIDERGRVTRR